MMFLSNNHRLKCDYVKNPHTYTQANPKTNRKYKILTSDYFISCFKFQVTGLPNDYRHDSMWMDLALVHVYFCLHFAHIMIYLLPNSHLRDSHGLCIQCHSPFCWSLIYFC